MKLLEVMIIAKDEIRGLAVKLLQEANLDNIERISISEENYDNGTPYLEIVIDYKEVRMSEA